MAGSAFFLGKESDGGRAEQVFLVTAKHVIDGIRRLGVGEVYVRANLKSGQATWLKCEGEWLFHPDNDSVDLALLRTGIPEALDHLAIPHSLCATDQTLKDQQVGLGDEVFVVGLLRHHSGDRKNIPIVRVGNLAAMTEEKVVTRSFGPMDAYLIEARSIGGLSGSAVFLNLGVVRYVTAASRLPAQRGRAGLAVRPEDENRPAAEDRDGLLTGSRSTRHPVQAAHRARYSSGNQARFPCLRMPSSNSSW